MESIRTVQAGIVAQVLIGTSLAVVAVIMVLGPSCAVPDVGPGGPMRSLGVRLPDGLVTGLIRGAMLVGAAGMAAGLWAVHRGWLPLLHRWWMAGAAAIVTFTCLLPAGATDALNYAIYGRITALGRDPYQMTPAQLRAAEDPLGLLGPGSWENLPSVYGPVGTVFHAAAGLLGDGSMAWTVFWIKVGSGLAFAATAVLLDRLAAPDPARRARVLLLWTLNPVMLLWLVAGAHIDVFIALAVVSAIALLKRSGKAAGALLGIAVAIKAPVVLLAPGLALTRRPAAISIGFAAIVLPVYLLVPRSITVLTDRAEMTASPVLPIPSVITQATPVYGVLLLAIGIGCGFLLWRTLPEGHHDLPAIRAVLVFAVCWMMLAPAQFPWYDAAVFALLPLMTATRLDWLVLAHAVILSHKALPGVLAVPQAGASQVAPATSTLSPVQLAMALLLGALVLVSLSRRWTAAPQPLGAARPATPPRPRPASEPLTAAGAAQVANRAE